MFLYFFEGYNKMNTNSDDLILRALYMYCLENNKEIEISVDFAEDLINQEATSEKYRNMSLTERKEYVQGILSQLESDGYIKYLIYDSDNYLFSFEYIDL